MKVRYKVTMYGDLAETVRARPDDINAVTESGVEHCCESMRRLWGRVVTLGDIYYNSDCHDIVGIYDCEPYEGDSPGFHPIAFCPFCGERIEREVDERFTLISYETTETRTRYKSEKVEESAKASENEA